MADFHPSNKSKSLPTVQYLRECLEYNPETGILKWKRRPIEHFKNQRDCNVWNGRNANKQIGCLRPDGYLCFRLDRHIYLSHRIIFKLMNGVDPCLNLDHRNLCKSDNRWENLREATKQQNGWNSGVRPTNILGIKNVWFSRKRRKFVVRIGIGNGKRKFIGHFTTVQEANQAAICAAKSVHGEFCYMGK